MSQPAAPRITRSRRSRRPGAPAARQRGVALLIAILLVALGTMIAATLAYDNAMTARRTIAALNYDQALLITEGAEDFAAYGLQQIFQNTPAQGNQPAHLVYPGQAWGQPLGPIEVAPGVTLEAHLEDLEGRFNLNDLVSSDGKTPNNTAIAAFQNLLAGVGLERKWAEDAVNWISQNPTPPFPDAASDTAYLEMDPPYHAPNLPITSASELLALPGFGRERFEKIAPYVTALPQSALVNYCSASPEVLNAFLGHEEYSDPKEFAKQRAAASGCFPSRQDFSAAYSNTGAGGGGGSPAAFMQNFTPETSSWFELTTYVSAGSTEFAFYSVLYRDPTTGKVRVILRSDTPN